ncbi:MAG: type II toxin-antitoxin system MqsR family toxin [Bacillota bacterium]
MHGKQILIELYLKQVRCYIDEDNVDMRKSDKENLTQLGISYQDAKLIVKSLTSENYVAGPDQDHLIAEQDVYFFGYDCDGIELYIKLTIRIKNDLFIMSFHEAKFKLDYPFKNC